MTDTARRPLLERARTAPLRYLPRGVLAEPFELFLAGIAVLNGVPLLLSDRVRAASIEALLPEWLVVAWGLELLLGGLLTAGGLLGRKPDVERVGLLLLGPAALVYGLAISLVVGLNGGAVASGITTAFGLACLLRAYVIRLVREVELASMQETRLQRVAMIAALERAAQH